MTRKLATLFLVLYVLLLLTQPCQDVFAIRHSESNPTFAHVERGQVEGCESETCSPFCICSCCSLSVAYHTFSSSFTIERTAIAPTASEVTYKTPYDLTIYTAIWQPPKA